MATVEDIESAVTKLSKENFERLLEWIEEYAQDQWDREMEADIAAGKLDDLAAEAIRDFRDGKCRTI